MKLFKKDLDFEVAVVAEVGVNHEGSVDVACRLISLAAEAGADAVKFQSYNPDRFISSDDPDRLSRARSFCLTESDHHRLAEQALSLGIHYFSTAVTEDMVPFIQNLGGVVKVASGDLTFKPVITALAKTRKPFIVSTGLATVSDIDRCMNWILEEIPEADLRNHLILMHCVSAYPTPIDEANILSVPFLAERYGLHVGYSHHVLEFEPCLAAVALGASIVEVHFTDRRNGREFRDHALSFEPEQLADLVSSIAKVRTSLGTYDKTRQNCELPNLNLIRKGVVAAHDLEFGTILSADHLSYARPATEYSSEQIDELIGKVLTVNLSKGQLIPRAAISD